MTNWMTAAGLAFIAGGLATLISFRAVLFGGGARRANRAGSSARRRRPETVRSAPGPHATTVEPRPARRRRLAAAFSGRPAESPDGRPAEREEDVTGLASIGLADEDDEDAGRSLGLDDYDPGEDEHYDPETVPEPVPGDERTGYEEDYREDDSWPPRRRHREPEPGGHAWARRDAENPTGYAGRYTSLNDENPIPDWEWPRYQHIDDRPSAGDYWTPVPGNLYSAPELGPLPPVPDYEPATGFDLPPVTAESAPPNPEWPPREHRVRLPRSWSDRGAQPRHGHAEADGRPSPRPRPAAPYVSKHAAGPH